VSRRLRSGVRRVFKDHRSVLAVQYRREFKSLVEGLGIADGDAMLRAEAEHAAMLAVRARQAAADWAAVAEQRARGRGRRPSASAVERAARRAALDDATHREGVDRLRALAGERKPPLDLARAIAAAQENGR
jgi:hypothetical protein